jgi:hypothetical protein
MKNTIVKIAYASKEAKIGQFEIVIPNLVIDCRLSDPVVPAKAGIQALPINIMQKSFGDF